MLLHHDHCPFIFHSNDKYLDVSSALERGKKYHPMQFSSHIAETKVRAMEFICSRFSHQCCCLLLLPCKAFPFNWIYGSVEKTKNSHFLLHITCLFNIQFWYVYVIFCVFHNIITSRISLCIFIMMAKDARGCLQYN